VVGGAVAGLSVEGGSVGSSAATSVDVSVGGGVVGSRIAFMVFTKMVASLIWASVSPGSVLPPPPLPRNYQERRSLALK